MSKNTRQITACYCGSFDPVTHGHLDVIQRGLSLCHKLVIGVGDNPRKNYLFDVQERRNLVEEALSTLDNAHETKVIVESYNGATVDFAQKHDATVIFKGLRGAADYAYEEKMAIINHRLNNDIDTIFLFTDNALRDVSSSVAKEIALIGAERSKLDHYLTKDVKAALLEKFKDHEQGSDDYDPA